MMYTRIFILAVCFVVAAALPTGTAQALTKRWNTTMPTLCGLNDPKCPHSTGWFVLRNGHATVEYEALVKNASTGATIACGSTVPWGTRVAFRFAPHTYRDITWFGTGTAWDSPYGAWTDDAKAPRGINMCSNPYKLNRIGREVRGMAYGVFTVGIPDKTISGLPGGCTTAADGVSKICALNTEGPVHATFNFAPTNAKMYGAIELLSRYRNLRIGDCLGDPHRMASASSVRTEYEVRVPRQTISCTVHVGPRPDEPGNPTTPTVGPGGSGPGGSCVINTTFALRATGSDSLNENIRYLIDWNADSTPDSRVPSSGFVPSGTPQTFTRTFPTAGTYTVKVRTENESGVLSSWASYSFPCGTHTEADLSDDDDRIILGDDADPSDGEGLGIGGGGALSGDLTLRAIPSMVRPGTSSRVHWSSAHMNSCSVTGTNGDGAAEDPWTGKESPVSGKTTSPIVNQTVYTLTCLGSDGATYKKEARVYILPSWSEQ